MSGSEKSDNMTTAERVMQAEDMYYRQGMTQAQIAEVLGVSQPAVSDLLRKTHKAMRVQKSLEDYVIDHYFELQSLKIEAVAIPKLAQKIEVMLAILDREMKLLGTAAPARTESKNVTVNIDSNSRFHRFIQAAAGLSDKQLESVLQFAAGIKREPLPLPAGPPSLQLTEGE